MIPPKGINVGEKEIKVSLYADDTTVFVRDPDSVDHLLTLLYNFKNLSGLEINNASTIRLFLLSQKILSKKLKSQDLFSCIGNSQNLTKMSGALLSAKLS